MQQEERFLEHSAKGSTWKGYYTSAIEKKSDDLEHHGILGQKWGVRRYQNPDGTLTAEGKRRLYGASGSQGGYESLRSRNRRSIQAAKYERDLAKNNKKLGKAMDKGDEKKIAKYTKAEEILSTNRDHMIKDLSPEEIKMGQDYLKMVKNTTIGNLIAGPIGGIVSGGITRLSNNMSENEKKVYAQDAERKASYKKTINDESEVNKKAVDAAKKAGLDQGDNWKVYRDAQAGDKKSQELVKKWESDNAKQKTATKQRELKEARDNGSYQIEFLEAIQNKGILGPDKKDVALREYEKYLNDPDDYIKNGRHKLPDE